MPILPLCPALFSGDQFSRPCYLPWPSFLCVFGSLSQPVPQPVSNEGHGRLCAGVCVYMRVANVCAQGNMCANVCAQGRVANLDIFQAKKS